MHRHCDIRISCEASTACGIYTGAKEISKKVDIMDGTAARRHGARGAIADPGVEEEGEDDQRGPIQTNKQPAQAIKRENIQDR